MSAQSGPHDDTPPAAGASITIESPTPIVGQVFVQLGDEVKCALDSCPIRFRPKRKNHRYHSERCGQLAYNARRRKTADPPKAT